MNWTQWPKTRQVRELRIVELDRDRCRVIACDSLGAVGNKELDELRVPYFIVGRCAARVPLMEVLAVGAQPVLISDGLTVEMEPSGREIIAGIKHELQLLGLEDKCHLTGSTEENFVTRQSGLGITVVALARPEELRTGRVQPGDEILCFGLPKLGAEVNLDDPAIVHPSTVLRLLERPEVHEMVPVGSKGILFEARLLAAPRRGQLNLDPNCPLPLRKSAGPATCLLAAVAPGTREVFSRDFPLPVTYIGTVA